MAMASLSSLVGKPELESDAKYYTKLLMSVSWVEFGFASSLFTCWSVTYWKHSRRSLIEYWLGLLTVVRKI